MQVAEWQAIVRTTVKRYQQVGLIPIKLGKAFTTAFLFGEEAVKEYLLLESFLSYLTSDERELVNLSLNGKLDKEQENEWLDLLERFNCETVPKAKQVKDVVLEIAHKEFIQTPRYIVDSWGKPTNKKIITFRRKPWDLRIGGILILFETLFLGDRRWEINKVLKILYRL